MRLLSLFILAATLSFGAVDINKADKKELMTLDGVGEAKAAAILEYRKAHNCFSNVEEIKEVKGFADKFLEKNKKNMTAGECKNKKK